MSHKECNIVLLERVSTVCLKGKCKCVKEQMKRVTVTVHFMVQLSFNVKSGQAICDFVK